MRVSIDKAGRLVIPGALREAIGIEGATELELNAVDGRLVLTVADVPARVEGRRGFSVIATDWPMGSLSVGDTRTAVERVRR